MHRCPNITYRVNCVREDRKLIIIINTFKSLGESSVIVINISFYIPG